MRKYLLTIIMAAVFLVVSTSSVWAANLSVRLEQPKSPTNQDNLNINFVALDVLNRTVTVKCFKKGPSDGSFTQFGSDINLAAGGNTGNCSLSSAILSTEGTYQFYVTASADAESVDSAIVSMDFKTSGPGTPSNYSKEQINSCTYRIKFRTADDGGKTVKVELYRSDVTNIIADAGSRVATLAIGSNTDGQIENTVPDCGKTYYYILRAFDSVGNGSGVIGDSVTKVIITTTTVVSPTPVQGAIVAEVGGEVLGAKKPEEVTPEITGEAAPTGQIAGAEAQQVSEESLVGRILNFRNVLLGILAIIFLIIAISYLRRSKE